MRRLALWLSMVSLAPAVAFAATPSNYCELVKWVVNVLNSLTALMVLAALVVYLFNIVTNLRGGGESHIKLRNAILWGIIAIFVMVSVWGILRILQDTLFPTQNTTSGAPAC